MKIKSVQLSELRKLRGYRLKHLMRAKGQIPTHPGVYIWRYWPSMPDVDEADSFVDTIEKWGADIPSFSEETENARLSVSITRKPLGNVCKVESFLGIKRNSSKGKKILKIVNESKSAREQLASILECVIANFQPLYVGKADNLQDRLIEHFDRKTPVLDRIKEANVPVDDIYISFIEDTVAVTGKDSITDTIEYILQNITNPPLTKRYG